MEDVKMKVTKHDDLVDYEEDLDKHALRVFEAYNFSYWPTFPKVYIRVLPKEQTRNGIILPGTAKQNKPIWEGIVVRTWKPHTIHYTKMENGRSVECSRTLVSEYQPGDHALYPHFAGQPLPAPLPQHGTDEQGNTGYLYRAIPEGVDGMGRVVIGNDAGVLLGKVEYERESLDTMLWKCFPDDINDEDIADELVKNIKEKFELIPKNLECKTMSGV